MSTNFNDSLPVATAGHTNVEFQTDGSGNVSAQVPTALPATTQLPVTTTPVAGEFLSSYDSVTGLFAQSTPAGGGGGGFSSLVGYRHTAQIIAADPSGTPRLLGDEANPTTFSGYNAAVPANNQAASFDCYSSGTDVFGGMHGNTSAPVWYTGTNLNLWTSLFYPQTVSERCYIGMFESTLTPATLFATDTETAHKYACFRFSTVAGDTHIQCITCDGSAQNVQSSGVVLDTKSHNYLIVFDDTTPSVKFYIDGTLVATSIANLPGTSGTLMYYVTGAATEGATAHIGMTAVAIQADF